MGSSSSSCLPPQRSQSLTTVSFGIYEPQHGCDTHDVIAHITKVAALLEKTSNIKVAILKSFKHSWAAVFTKCNGESDGDNWTLNLPGAGSFTKGMNCAVKTVDSGWFQVSSQEISRGVPFAQLSLGDIVSIRRMYISSRKKQDLFSYSCLAILKSYFAGLKGVLSYSFFDSMDGRQIIGLGVWDSVESASFLENNPKSNPALPFWKDLGAKKLKYDVCQVVYVSYQNSRLQISRPGFEI